MKERPILMSAEMVRAILDGRKTQTRRPMKPQPEPIPDGAGSPKGYWIPSNKCQTMLRNKDMVWDCPFGQPGDRLWVRETWSYYEKNGKKIMAYKASDDPDAWSWRPSIHMPRWASRLLLEITDVRVERVQEITDADSMLEGCHYGLDGEGYSFSDKVKLDANTPAGAFRILWENLYPPHSQNGWPANPWVWVVSFKVVKS